MILLQKYELAQKNLRKGDGWKYSW
jgi:hypothetical protein